jgi:hypothetical protein
MTIAEKIFKFLQAHSPRAYCDDCVAGECDLWPRQVVASRTEAFSLCAEFHREQETCAGCLSEGKLVTNAVQF